MTSAIVYDLKRRLELGTLCRNDLAAGLDRILLVCEDDPRAIAEADARHDAEFAQQQTDAELVQMQQYKELNQTMQQPQQRSTPPRPWGAAELNVLREASKRVLTDEGVTRLAAEIGRDREQVRAQLSAITSNGVAAMTRELRATQIDSSRTARP